jgi:hypothetical protein
VKKESTLGGVFRFYKKSLFCPLFGLQVIDSCSFWKFSFCTKVHFPHFKFFFLLEERERVVRFW